MHENRSGVHEREIDAIPRGDLPDQTGESGMAAKPEIEFCPARALEDFHGVSLNKLSLAFVPDISPRWTWDIKR